MTGLLVLALFFGALMPAGLKQGMHSMLGLALPWPSIGHFVLFALIALVSPYGTGIAAERRALFVALLLALSTEALQHWVPGRHPMLRDVAIDLAGTVAGRMLLWSGVLTRMNCSRN
jgi:hypothetical protein